MISIASASIDICSVFAIFVICAAIIFLGNFVKRNRWVLESIVSGIFSYSVVAIIITPCCGGSSSVFNSALNAAVVNMCASSMINTL